MSIRYIKHTTGAIGKPGLFHSVYIAWTCDFNGILEFHILVNVVIHNGNSCIAYDLSMMLMVWNALEWTKASKMTKFRLVSWQSWECRNLKYNLWSLDFGVY